MAHIRTRETYGTRRLQTELAENGIIVGRDRLARLRKELRLRCKQKRKFRATTNPNHNLPVAPNLLNQTFAPTAPNQVWVADLTYVDGCSLASKMFIRAKLSATPWESA
ncbi:putative transposase [Shigella flexneri K-218]|nr:putative transposase [Shigella flexneri K-218]